MTQLDFDAALAAKAAGLDRVEATHPDFVPRMRDIAISHSAIYGSVHIDDLRIEADRRGIRPRSPNVWGSIFRGPGWVKVGARASAWPSNHGHVSPIWRWIGA